MDNPKLITIKGQRVTFERDNIGWIAVGWEKGLPVAKRPVSREMLQEILNKFPKHLVTVS